jgi:hypothetical protein
MIRRGPSFRTLSAFLLVTTTACVTWRPYEASPTPPDEDLLIRLHLTSGETVPLRGAFTVGDSMWVGERTDVNPPRQAQIRFTEVQDIEEGRHGLTRRGKIVSAAIAVGLLVWLAIEIERHGLGIESLGGG